MKILITGGGGFLGFRLARTLLARGQQWERDKVTNVAPRWSAGTFTMTNVDGTADSDPTGAGAVNNWRHYRYNVYEAVVPLRNTIIGRQL